MVYTGNAPEGGLVPSHGYEGSPVYECVVTDGDEEWPLALQFWAVVEGSGIYLAWQFDEPQEVGGRYGVFEGGWLHDDGAHRVVFSRPDTHRTEHPALSAAGVAVPAGEEAFERWMVADPDAITEISRWYWMVMGYFQSPTMRVTRLDWRPDRTLAPNDAVTGRTFEVGLEGYGDDASLLGQFWRWPDRRAVHLAWVAGSSTGMFGTFLPSGSARLGGEQAVAPLHEVSTYGFFTAADDHEGALATEHRRVRGEIDDESLLRVVEGPTERESEG